MPSATVTCPGSAGWSRGRRSPVRCARAGPIAPAAVLLLGLLLAACAAPKPPAATVPVAAPPESPLGRLVARAGFVSVLAYAPGERRAEPRRVVLGGGSGTLIGTEGLVVTAAHVAVGEGFPVEVTTVDGARFAGRVLALLPEKDLAFLCVPGLIGRAGVRLRLSDPLPGAPVLAFGSPREGRIAAAAGRVRGGRLSGSIHYGRFVLEAPLELALTIGPGFSGGPVVDVDGELVGMLASFALDTGDDGDPPGRGLAFAVPGKTLAAELPAARCAR